jgi:Endoplasmic reticulum protein ERp29, C-terminal domain
MFARFDMHSLQSYSSCAHSLYERNLESHRAMHYLNIRLGAALAQPAVCYPAELSLTALCAAAVCTYRVQILDKGPEYVQTEQRRLGELLKASGVVPAKRTLFMLKKNILVSFQEAPLAASA